MFSKKPSPKKPKEVPTQPVTSHPVHGKPLVCLFDTEESVAGILTNQSYNCTSATTGSIVKVPNKDRLDQHFLKLNCTYPENLHEYDVVVFDMESDEIVEYSQQKIDWENVRGPAMHVLLSEYPETLFDPRPYAIAILSRTVNELLKRESVIVIFAGTRRSVEYSEVKIEASMAQPVAKPDFSNSAFYTDFPSCFNKTGQSFRLPSKETRLSDLLEKYSPGSRYELVFHHPMHWNRNKQEEDPSFVPLLLNKDGETVSFFHGVGNGGVFVFPQIGDQSSFLKDLFNHHLSEMYPTLFPFHGQFGWLDGGDYLLPNEEQLNLQKKQIEDKYRLDIEALEQALKENRGNYGFLRYLLSETGEKLVKAVEQVLRWLEFDRVVNVDETAPSIREEDLQVESEKGLLVIEVKGIGGTSTDKDCSQISKIRFRRAEERGKFDVSGLYLVNHQRYMPPKSRQNPPFTESQVKDAVMDRRGLLTTYVLFRAYFMVEEGILTKREVREQLYQSGLVTFRPTDVASIGTPSEYYRDGMVVVVLLKDTPIRVGDTLLTSKNGLYSKVRIESIQINDSQVEHATSGEIGIKLDQRIPKNAELFVCGGSRNP